MHSVSSGCHVLHFTDGPDKPVRIATRAPDMVVVDGVVELAFAGVRDVMRPAVTAREPCLKYGDAEAAQVFMYGVLVLVVKKWIAQAYGRR